MIRSFDPATLPVSRTIARHDTMLSQSDEAAYFALGENALQSVAFAAALCEKQHFPSILDFACGYGRVLRWLRAGYPYAAVTACDLDRRAVDFCTAEFGARAVYSASDMRTLPFGSEFDLIWCGSLLTHLDEQAWLDAFDRMIAWTADCGVIVFSTHGRFFASLLAKGEAAFADNIDAPQLLRGFHQRGFAFEPYFEDPTRSYGISVTSPEFVSRAIQRYPGVILRAYMEQAWGVQDLVILYKRDGFFGA